MADRQKWSIFLDLDNTILDFTWAEKRALFQTLSELGIEPTEEIRRRYVAWNIYCWEQLEEGKMEREEVLVRRFELLFEEIGVQR